MHSWWLVGGLCYLVLGILAARMGWALNVAPLPKTGLSPADRQKRERRREHHGFDRHQGIFRVVAFAPASLAFIVCSPLIFVAVLPLFIRRPIAARDFTFMIVYARMPELDDVKSWRAVFAHRP